MKGGFLGALIYKVADTGVAALSKKLDPNSKYEKQIRNSLLNFSNQYYNCDKIFKKPEHVLGENIDFSCYQEFSDCPIIDKNYLFKFVRTLCLRKNIDHRHYKDELRKLESQTSNGGYFFNETFYLEHTYKNVEVLKYIFNGINQLIESAQIRYENSKNLIMPFALLICKNEKTEEEVDSCLAGLYACHSILICKGTRVRFFLDTMGKLFNGKLSATYNLIDTLPSQPISDISSEREKSINKLAKQTQFQFQQKKNIIEVYKLIYKLHLVVHEKNTIEDANSITELEFLKLSKILPSDLSNEYLIDELFSNLTASSYFSYRHLFLNH